MATEGRKPFPQSVEEFAADDRISYDKQSEQYVLVSENGTEYEFNAKYGKWIEMIDPALIAQQQSAYFNPEAEAAAENDSKKRKAEEKSTQETKKAKKEPVERKNTSVYVTGLPEDATFDEIHAVFKKYGLIANNVDSELPKIKMYANEDLSFKGEALVTYFRPESVKQAIYMLDETDLRTGMTGTMRVEKADMSFKKTKEFVPGVAKGKRSKNDVEKIKRMTSQMNARLADWDDDDPQVVEAETKPTNKFDKFLVVKNMFRPQQLEDDPGMLFELPGEIRDQAKDEDWGEIASITVFDQEPAGVVRIKFRTAEAAQKAQMRMDGRFFDYRQLEAYVPDKREYFRKSERNDSDDERRLQQYGEELAQEDEDQNENEIENGTENKNGDGIENENENEVEGEKK